MMLSIAIVGGKTKGSISGGGKELRANSTMCMGGLLLKVVHRISTSKIYVTVELYIITRNYNVIFKRFRPF